MTTRAPQSTYEKTVASLLLLITAAVAWAPHMAAAWQLPSVERPGLFVALAMAVFALGLVHDAAERHLGAGRGLYAVVVFCSLPAVGCVVGDPATLAAGGLALMVALALWLAVSATGDNRPYFLVMLGVLLAVGGFLFSPHPAVFALMFPIWLAARPSEPIRTARLLLIFSLCAGLLLRWAFPLPFLTIINVSSVPAALSGFVWLPWLLFALPAAVFAFAQKSEYPKWWNDAAGVLVLVLVTNAIAQRGSMALAAAGCAPILALLTADGVHDEFARERVKGRLSILATAAILTAIMALVLTALALFKLPSLPPLGTPIIVIIIFLMAALTWTARHRLLRWVFVALFGSGILFGYLLDWREPLFPDQVPPLQLSWWVLVFAGGAAAVGLAVAEWLYRRHLPRGEADRSYLFAEDNARIFSGSQGNVGVPVRIFDGHREEVNVAIFGDVTGAESPVSSRRAGFLAFRALTHELEALQPDLAVSLGDLATQATPPAYRRLRRLLARISAPLVVTPGNHDLFVHNEYNAAAFHREFGADNCAFRCGPLLIVILNNAWGSVAAAQFEWLPRVLQIDAPFKLVFCHKPLFDLRDGVFYAMEDRAHALRLHDLFQAHNVTAVFSGHIHSLLSQVRDGVTYVISGGGGSKLTAEDDQHHYLILQANAREIILRAIPLSSLHKSAEPTPLLELRFSART